MAEGLVRKGKAMKKKRLMKALASITAFSVIFSSMTGNLTLFAGENVEAMADDAVAIEAEAETEEVAEEVEIVNVSYEEESTINEAIESEKEEETVFGSEETDAYATYGYDEHGALIYIVPTDAHKTEIVIPSKVKMIKSLVFGDKEYFSSEANIGKVVTLNLTGATSLEEIGDNVFSNFTGIKTVNIPKSVKYIGSSAFNGCTGLTTVNFPMDSDLELIKSKAFMGCSSLGGVDFTKCSQLSKIDSEAFKNCSALANVKFNKKLTYIQSEAFSNDKLLKEVTLESGLKVLGGSAFKGCTDLSKVTLCTNSLQMDSRSSSKKVGAHTTEIDITYQINAFNGCGLKDIVYGVDASGVQVSTIPTAVFAGATFDITPDAKGQRVMTIPENIQNVGAFAFAAVTTIDVFDFSPASINNVEVTIAQGAFEFNFMEEIYLPSRLTKIEDATFLYCPYLTVVTDSKEKGSNTLPLGVKEIGNEAFSCDASLKSIVLPASLTSIGAATFSYCTSLLSIVIPANVESMGIAVDVNGKEIETYDGVFEKCEVLASVEFLGSLKMKKIPRKCFKECTALSTIAIPKNIETIDESAFELSGLVSIDLGEKLVTIGKKAFLNCGKLATVDMPDTVTDLLESAFQECVLLTKVEWSSTLKNINNKAFLKCELLTNENELPDCVELIGVNAFQYCYSLEEAVIPKSVTKIGTEAFGMYTDPSTTKLKTITYNAKALKTDLTRSSAVFYGCDKVESISFGNDITMIPSYLLNGVKLNKPIKNIDIPATVITIGKYAFTSQGKNDNEAKDEKKKYLVATLGNPLEIEAITFTGTPELETVGEGAFKYTKISTFDIPNSVTEMGASSLEGCASLTSVMIGGGLKEISSNMFAQDNHLVKVEFRPGVPISVTSIGAFAFSECKGLLAFDIPSAVTTVGGYAFASCHSLEQIYFPSTVTSFPETDPYTVLDDAKSSVKVITTAGSKAAEVFTGHYTVITEGVHLITYNFDAYPTAKNGAGNGLSYLEGLTLVFAPAEMSKSTFIGWYTDSACTTKITDTSNCKTDLELYPKFETDWDAIQYNLKFVTNNMGVSGAPQIESKVLKGSEQYTLPSVEKDGYKFKGWCSEKTGATGVIYSANAVVSKLTTENEYTLYAIWEKIPDAIKCTIKFSASGAKTVPETVVLTGEETYTLPAVEKDGYTFAGWKSSVGQKVFSAGDVVSSATLGISKTSTVTLTAQWTKGTTSSSKKSSSSAKKGSKSSSANTNPHAGEKFTIVYEENDPAVTINGKIEEYTAGDKVKVTTTATKVGYKFAGWYDKNTGKKVKINKKTYGDIVLEARWKPCKYAINFYVTEYNGTPTGKKMAGAKYTLAKKSPGVAKYPKEKFIKCVKDTKLAKNGIDPLNLMGYAPMITTTLDGSEQTVKKIIVKPAITVGTSQAKFEAYYADIGAITWVQKGKGWVGTVDMYPVMKDYKE